LHHVPADNPFAVQNASDQVIAANASQNPNGFDQLPRRLGAALATASARQAQRCMCTAFPVQGENKLARCAIHVRKNFLDQRANKRFFSRTLVAGLVQIVSSCWGSW